MKRRAFFKVLSGAAISLGAIYGVRFDVAELRVATEDPWTECNTNLTAAELRAMMRKALTPMGCFRPGAPRLKAAQHHGAVSPKGGDL